MKYFLWILCIGLLAGCSDGDLQIETIDFSSATAQFCGSTATVDSQIFFKISEDEALILELQSGILKNEVSDGTKSSTVPSQSQVTYRIFSEDVSKSYFCSDIPPSTPTVTEEIEAAGGQILVTTVQSESDTTAYEHTIELSGISLINESGERITDLNINNFGTITTQK